MTCDQPPMDYYLAEVFTPAAEPQQFGHVARVETAADGLRERGVRIRRLYSIFVAEEEITLHMFAAESPDDVGRALSDAGFEAERISLATALAGSQLPPTAVAAGSGQWD
jgi:hypothetical protein